MKIISNELFLFAFIVLSLLFYSMRITPKIIITENRKMNSVTCLFLIIISVLVMIQVSSAQEKICAGCGKKISAEENYKIVLGKLYHPDHFCCAFCKKVITGKFIHSDGKFYHSHCYKKSVLPRCAVCGNPIETEYVTVESKTYHVSCYTDSIAPRCSLCGEVIQEEYIEDFWGNRYHSYHQQDHPQCWYCGRFISAELTGGGSRESNNQFICSICLEDAVDDIKTARQIVDRVRRQLEPFGISIRDAELDLRLSSWDELKQLTPAASKNHTGFTESEVVYYNGKKLNEKFKIYILNNLPTYHFITTAAHELMHVWQHMYGSDSNLLPVVEGSCNYAAFLVLKSSTDKRAKYMIESMATDQSPVYGDGFRFIRDYVTEKGRGIWLLQLRQGLHFQ
jgi:hypothetical protein